MINPTSNSRFNLILDVGIDGDIILSAAIDYCKPDGTLGFWPASVVPDTTRIVYEVQAGEIDIPGIWTFQSFIITAEGEAHGIPVNLVIQRTLRPTGHTH